MPRSTKEANKEVEKKSTKKVKKADEKATKVAKKTPAKKTATKKEPKLKLTTLIKKAVEKTKPASIKKKTTTKKSTENKKTSTPKKTASPKKADTEKKVTSTKKVDSEKKVVKKESTTSKKKTTTKSLDTKKPSTTKTAKTTKATKTATKKSVSTKSKKSVPDVVTNLEYYDLPYRYNKTIVKILTQTPNTLFIYWDISDEDRKKLEEQYGLDFFNSTRPVLIILNETKNFSYEIEINDFANSWYLHMSDTDCKYTIELGRKYVENNSNEYIYLSSSNDIKTPNDHIYGFDINDTIQFKNVKDNTYYLKKIKDIPSIRNTKLYKELLKEFMKDSQFNPSSNFKK